jgi:hypothetical protein
MRGETIWNGYGPEICRINGDGSTTYNWDAITAEAAKWKPHNVNITTCIAKLLIPFKPKEGEA